MNKIVIKILHGTLSVFVICCICARDVSAYVKYAPRGRQGTLQVHLDENGITGDTAQSVRAAVSAPAEKTAEQKSYRRGMKRTPAVEKISVQVKNGVSAVRRTVQEYNRPRYVYRPSFLFLIAFNMVFIPIDTLASALFSSRRPFYHKGLPQLNSPRAIALQLFVAIPFYFVAVWGAGRITNMFLGGGTRMLVIILFTVYWSFYHVGFQSAAEGYRLTHAKRPILISRHQRAIHRTLRVLLIAFFIATVGGFAISLVQAYSGGAFEVPLFVLRISSFFSGTMLMNTLSNFFGLTPLAFQHICIVIAALGFLLWDTIMTVSVFDRRGDTPYDLSQLRSLGYLYKVLAWSFFALVGVINNPVVLDILVVVIFSGYFITDAYEAVKTVRMMKKTKKYFVKVAEKKGMDDLETVLLNDSEKVPAIERMAALHLLFHIAQGRKVPPSIKAAYFSRTQKIHTKKAELQLEQKLVRRAVRTLVANLPVVLMRREKRFGDNKKAVCNDYVRLVDSLRHEGVLSGETEAKRRQFAFEQLCALIVAAHSVQGRKADKEQAHIIFCEAFEAVLHMLDAEGVPAEEQNDRIQALRFFATEHRQFLTVLQRLDVEVHRRIMPFIFPERVERARRQHERMAAEALFVTDPHDKMRIAERVNTLERILAQKETSKKKWTKFNTQVAALSAIPGVGVFVVSAPAYIGHEAFIQYTMKQSENFEFLRPLMNDYGLEEQERRFMRDLVQNIHRHVEDGIGVIVVERYDRDMARITVMDSGKGFVNSNDEPLSIADVIPYGVKHGRHGTTGAGLSNALAKHADVSVIEQAGEAGIIMKTDDTRLTDFEVTLARPVVKTKKKRGVRITGYFNHSGVEEKEWCSTQVGALYDTLFEKYRLTGDPSTVLAAA